MKPSKVHTCVFQEQVAMGKQEPRLIKKCHCRELITYEEADTRVKWGEALWVVVKREFGVREIECHLCKGDTTFLNCPHCKGVGKEKVAASWNVYNGDIAMINHRTKSNKISTPRVPTIEAGHIERAYGDSLVEVKKDGLVTREWIDSEKSAGASARMRIEEYGLLTLEARAFPGPSKCQHRKEFKCTRCEIPIGAKVNVIGTEPADNPKKGEGRNYDFGRAI